MIFLMGCLRMNIFSIMGYLRIIYRNVLAQDGRRNLEIKCCETLGLLEDASTIVFLKTDLTTDERIENEWSEEKSKMRIVLAEDALFKQKWVILNR